MSRRCEICGKGSHKAYNVSHSKQRTKKTQMPNLQKSQGKIVCTSCIRTMSKASK